MLQLSLYLPFTQPEKGVKQKDLSRQLKYRIKVSGMNHESVKILSINISFASFWTFTDWTLIVLICCFSIKNLNKFTICGILNWTFL